MIRRLASVALAVSLVLTACGGDDASSTSSETVASSGSSIVPGGDPGIAVESLATCDELADASITSTQNLIDEIDGLTLEEQTALFQDSTAEPLVFYQLVSRALEARADVLGCTDAQMEQLVLARVDALQATSDVGMLLIDSMRGLADEADPAALDGYAFTDVDVSLLDSCEAIADTGVIWTQDLLEFVDGLSTTEQRLLSSQENPAVFAALGALTVSLEDRAGEIDCSDETVQSLVAERVQGLVADSEYGRVLLGFFTGAATTP